MTPTLEIAYRSVLRIWRFTAALLPNIAIGVVVFGVFMLLARAVRWGVRKVAGRATRDQVVGELFGRLAATATIVAGFFVAAAVVFPSITPRDLLGGLGVGSVAIGFAFKDVLQNFLAGVLLMMRKPFRIGDQIVSGSFEGTVEDIEVRATVLRTYAGERILVPNAMVYTNAVKVLTAYEARRTEVTVGIGYGDDIEHARRAIEDAVGRLDVVRKSPAPDVYVVELAPSSVNVRVRYWTAPDIASVKRAEDAVNTAIKNALDEAGVDMPFPQTVVHWAEGDPVHIAAPDGEAKEAKEASH